MSVDKDSNGPFENPNGLSARPNFSPSQKNNNGVETRQNRRNQGKDQLPSPAAKRRKPSAGSGKKSQNNLDELVTQTNAKAMGVDKDSNGPSESPNGLSARPNFSPSQKKNNGVETRQNRRNQDKDQLPTPAAKRTRPSAGSGKKSQNNLDELVTPTNAKGISNLHQKHSDSTSKKNKKKAGKFSEQKKTPQVWSAKDETIFVNALLACTEEGGYVNMAAFYQQVKTVLGFTVSSNTQIYDKMRTMRLRFWNIHSKLKDENIPEEQFTFKSRHEASLFKVWKQIWGDTVKEHHEEEDGHNTSQVPFQNNGDDFNRDEGHRPEESSAPVVKKMIEEFQSKVETLIDSLIRRISASTNLQPFSPGFGGSGSCLCSSLSGRMKELIEGVRSVKEFPGLNKTESRELQQKWRNHRVEELRVFYQSLELLQEECALYLQELEN